MEKSMIKDLTVGSPFKLILSFAFPIFLGILFQQFYNIVDTMIVGRTLGVDALASVGATGSIMFMILGFCNGICSGFAIPIAQYFGAKDEHTMKKAVANSLWLSIFFSVVITISVTMLCRNILQWMNTPENIIELSYQYLIVIFWGIPITVFYNMFSAIIRSLGDSKSPVFFLILSSIINIGLDLLFIIVFKMGVAGAGYATVLSQLFSVILCAIYMVKKYTVLKMTKAEKKPDMHIIKKLLAMGIPMGLQYSITAIGSVILQTAVNGLGSIAVAAMTAGGKISLFCCAPFDALGTTMATYGGQNIGAKRLDRVDEGLKKGIIIGCVYAIAAFVVLFFFGKTFALLFVKKEETEIIKNISLLLICNSSCYIALALVNIVRFMIQGMGFSAFAVIAGVFEMFARAAFGFLLVPLFGFTAACFASPVAWILADVFLIPAYFYVKKKLDVKFSN